MTFCPYCGIDHDDSVPFSDEHVIPYAIGGSNQFTIRVCEASNNRLGDKVDRPIIEYRTVRSQRFFLGLKGTDGTEPTLDLSGIGWSNGEEVDIKYVIHLDGTKEIRITSRTIAKTKTEDGEHWQFNGSPEAIHKAIKGKIKSQEAQGKWVKDQHGNPLTLENLDELLLSGVTEIINPSILMRADFDHLWSWRFFSKLALASGHYVFGEGFSRSTRADVLRKTMNAQTQAEVELPHVAIWPETASVEPILRHFRLEKTHVIAVLYGAPNVLLVSLFGTLEACIRLEDPVPGTLPQMSKDGRILEVALPSRKLIDLSLVEYGALRSMRARRAAAREL